MSVEWKDLGFQSHRDFLKDAAERVEVLKKKFWLYLAVPMTLMNACRNVPAPTESMPPNQTDARTPTQDMADEPLGEIAAGNGASNATSGETSAQNEISDVLSEESGAQSNASGGMVGESSQENGADHISAGKNADAASENNGAQEAAFSGATVSIVRSERARAEDITEAEIEEMVRTAAADLGTVVQNGQTVVIKPNLVQMIVDSTGELLDEEVNGITTDWRVTKAVVGMVREWNPDGKVYLMEGSATGPTRAVMEHFHYTLDYLEGVDGFICLEEDCGAWQDFDAPEVVKVELPDGLLHESYYFNRILYEADVIISVPVLKTTSGAVVTAGIKNVSIGTPPGNLYGAGPDNPSKVHMVSHRITDGELDKWIYDYYRAKPVNYVIVDGLQGFQNGPVPVSHESVEGDRMNMRMILAGKDAVAVDTVCSLTVGWDPQSVGYLNLFRENMGLGIPANIRVKGAFVDELRQDFAIRRPELGGTPITEEKKLEFSAQAQWEGETLFIRYRAGEEVNKIEVYLNGIFQYAEAAQEEGMIRLEIPGFLEEEKELRIIAYDRFLNKCVVTGAKGAA